MWAGAFTSSVGTWMQEVAQNWLILTMTGSAFLLGLDAFLGDAPYLLFSLFGGVMADRVDRRQILLRSQYVQMGSAALLAVLLVAHAVQVWMILALSFVVGLAQSFGGPAYQALVPTLVDRQDLPNAVALNSIQFNLARVIGPVLAGHRVLQVRGAVVLRPERAVVPGSHRGALAPDGRRRRRQADRGRAREPEDRARRRSGTRRPLRGLIVLSFIGSFCAMPLVTFLPIFARSVFHQDAKGYSVLLACFGVGAICGAFGVAAFGNVKRKGALAVSMQMTLRRADGRVRDLAHARSFPTSCSPWPARPSWSSSRSS